MLDFEECSYSSQDGMAAAFSSNAFIELYANCSNSKMQL
jgi:hypothetical protein